MNRDLQIAFIQDALPFWGGAEKVLATALEAFPQAEVYTLVYRKEAFRDTIIGRREIHTSFVDRLPAARQRHRVYLPLMPLAIEQFDLSRYDILVSFSYAVAHGILPRPGQLHISYMHTPMRYSWMRGNSPARQNSSTFSLMSWLPQLYFHFFRLWDNNAANRVDHFVAVSQWIAKCIWRAYRRPADVLYPPVDLDGFHPYFPRSDYYLLVSRLVAHKRVDLVVEAFSRMGKSLVVVGDGPEFNHLSRIAGPNIRLLGWQPQKQLEELYGRARAFVHAGEEDFGIAMVEAQAAGCPVIALDAGAAPEIIQQGETGILFSEQSVDCLCSAVNQFERNEGSYNNPANIRENSRRFSKERFQKQFTSLVEEDWQQFQGGRREFDPLALHLSLAGREEMQPEVVLEKNHGF